jgi:hypothetical protein
MAPTLVIMNEEPDYRRALTALESIFVLFFLPDMEPACRIQGRLSKVDFV